MQGSTKGKRVFHQFAAAAVVAEAGCIELTQRNARPRKSIAASGGSTAARPDSARLPTTGPPWLSGRAGPSGSLSPYNQAAGVSGRRSGDAGIALSRAPDPHTRGRCAAG